MNDPRAIEAIVISAVTSETKASGMVRKVSLLLPNDSEAHPFAGLVGQRLHIVCVRINDDETTESESRSPGGPVASENAGASKSPTAPASKRSWGDLAPAAQAAMRCAEPEFQRFLCADNGEEAAQLVRMRCGVRSRSELNTDIHASAKWEQMENDYWFFQRNPRAA